MRNEHKNALSVSQDVTCCYASAPDDQRLRAVDLSVAATRSFHNWNTWPRAHGWDEMNASNVSMKRWDHSGHVLTGDHNFTGPLLQTLLGIRLHSSCILSLNRALWGGTLLMSHPIGSSGWRRNPDYKNIGSHHHCLAIFTTNQLCLSVS